MCMVGATLPATISMTIITGPLLLTYGMKHWNMEYLYSLSGTHALVLNRKDSLGIMGDIDVMGRKEITTTFSVGLVRIITVLFVIQWFDEVLITMAPINADNILLIETQGRGSLVFNHLKSPKQKASVGQIQEWKQNANLGFQVSPISHLINLKMWLIALLFQRYYCREFTLNFLRILLGSWVSAVSMKGTAPAGCKWLLLLSEHRKRI